MHSLVIKGNGPVSGNYLQAEMAKTALPEVHGFANYAWHLRRTIHWRDILSSGTQYQIRSVEPGEPVSCPFLAQHRYRTVIRDLSKSKQCDFFAWAIVYFAPDLERR